MNACTEHPTALAQYRCGGCGQSFCEACVKMVHAGGLDIASCQSCGGVCETLELNASDTLSFYERLPGAFVFPFQKGGGFVLVAGVLFFWFLDFMGWVPLLGLISKILGGGMLGAFLMFVAAQSALGKMEEGPTWPPMHDVGNDMLAPFFRLATMSILLGIPVAAAFFLAGPVAGGLVGLMVAGYAPMAFLGVSLTRNWSTTLQAPRIWRAIQIAPTQYAVAWLLFAVLFGVGLLLSGAQLGGGGVVVHALARFAGLYVALVEMRVLGLYYRANSEQIGWI